VKVAVIQFKAQKGDIPGAKRALGRLISAAGERGAELIVCPEMALTGYLFTDGAAAAEVAEPAAGEGLLYLGELAARHGAYLIVGYPERGLEAAADGRRPRLYNSARIVGPDGTLRENYRKRLLFDSDTTWAEPGDTPYPLVDLWWGQLAAGPSPRGLLSVGICMDLNDDRFTEFLREKRPRLLAFCTNWLDEGYDVLPYWQYRLRGTRSYFLAANTYGSEEAPGHKLTRFCGGSAILAPGGQLMARGPREGDAIVMADLPDA
jgi:predicted amidohydrolase